MKVLIAEFKQHKFLVQNKKIVTKSLNYLILSSGIAFNIYLGKKQIFSPNGIPLILLELYSNFTDEVLVIIINFGQNSIYCLHF